MSKVVTPATAKTTVEKKKASESEATLVSDTVEVIKEVEHLSATPLCEVGFSGGITRNMGNYESMRFHVSVRIPCLCEELDECFDYAKEWVDEKLNAINSEYDSGGQ